MGEQSLSNLKDRARAFQCFSLALDESNDVSDTAHLLIFVRGIDTRFEVTVELAALKRLKGTTTGKGIFKKLRECLNMLQLKWENLKSGTSDGARKYDWLRLGVVAPIHLHFVIHQQSLCSEVMRLEFVMKVVVPTINFIRSHGLNHRQFQ
ncbi:unnamed protein product, partial [Ixodes persulcatus]